MIACRKCSTRLEEDELGDRPVLLCMRCFIVYPCTRRLELVPERERRDLA